MFLKEPQDQDIGHFFLSLDPAIIADILGDSSQGCIRHGRAWPGESGLSSAGIIPSGEGSDVRRSGCINSHLRMQLPFALFR